MKRFYILLLSLFAILTVFVLSSCGGTKDDGNGDYIDDGSGDNVDDGSGDDGSGDDGSGDDGSGGYVEMCPMDQHQMSEWKVQKEATCTEDGVNIRTCVICGLFSQTQPVRNTTNHKYENYVCVRCGDSINPIKVNFTLSSDKTYYILSSVESMETTEYTVPSTYEGLPVKEIAPRALELCKKLETVVVPDSVELIGEGAFSKCYKLKKITLPFVGMNKSSTNAVFGYIFGVPSDGKDDGLRPITQNVGDGKRVFYIPPTLVDVKITGGELYTGCFMNCVDIRRIEYTGKGTMVYDRAFDNCQKLDQVTLPFSIAEYGERTFQNCYELDTFPLNEGIDKIGNYCFAGCKNTDYLALPSSLSEVGDGAFSDCIAIKNVIIPSSIEHLPSYMFVDCTALETVTLEESTSSSYEIKSIGRYCFSGCSALKTVNIASTVKDVKKGAFRDCVKLESVLLPKKIDTIEEIVFENCSSLKFIEIPNGVETISKNAFDGCKALESIKIPSSLKEIEENAFINCSSLTNFDIHLANTNFKSIEGHILSGTGKKLILVAPGFNGDTLTIPEGITDINDGAFDNALLVQNIVFPSTLVEIDNEVFQFHPSLKGIVINSTMQKIGKFSFAGCPNLETVEIKGFVSIIDVSAFTQCPKLKSVVIDNVQTISESAFYLNESLETVELSNIGLVGENAFAECKKLKTLTIGENVKVIATEAFAYCESIETLTIGEGAESIGEFTFSYCKKLQNVDIKTGLISIGEAAFEGCESLTEVHFPSTLENINAYAFKLCNSLTKFSIDFGNSKYGVTKNSFLVENDMESQERTLVIVAPGVITEELTIPNNIHAIGPFVFRHATQLKKVTLPESLKVIGQEAFFDSGLTEINLENVEVIKQYGLGQTKLTSLVIPESVKVIEKYAFQYCYDLKEIYIRSTVEKIGEVLFHNVGTEEAPFTIYLEFADEESIPSDWHSNWLASAKCEVVYGYDFSNINQDDVIDEIPEQTTPETNE